MPCQKENIHHLIYPPFYKNLPVKLCNKAVEIANAILAESGDEGLVIAKGLKKARKTMKTKQGVSNILSASFLVSRVNPVLLLIY